LGCDVPIGGIGVGGARMHQRWCVRDHLYYLMSTEKSNWALQASRASIPFTPLPSSSTGRRAPFIKGPLPLHWMAEAAGLPGRCLQVGLVIWYLHGLTKQKQFRLRREPLSAFGVERHAARRALVRLRDAGLIEVEFHRGRRPVVTLLGA